MCCCVQEAFAMAMAPCVVEVNASCGQRDAVVASAVPAANGDEQAVAVFHHFWNSEEYKNISDGWSLIFTGARGALFFLQPATEGLKLN